MKSMMAKLSYVIDKNPIYKLYGVMTALDDVDRLLCQLYGAFIFDTHGFVRRKCPSTPITYNLRNLAKSG